MSTPFAYRPLANEHEEQRLKTLDSQCFIGSENDANTYFDQIKAENFRVLCQADQIIGGLSLLPMGQWWGGQWVSMAGIAAVGIFPEHRGGGSALALMRAAVQELYESEFALSVLYPATQRLYRKAGYEQGGTRCRWEIRTEHIGIAERSLSMTPISPDLDLLKPIYAQYAKRHNGLGDRHPSIWRQKIHAQSDETIYAYRVGSEVSPQGYIVFTQKRDHGQGILTIRDWTATTVEAAKTLWGFLFSHRSQIDLIRWFSGATDPMLPLLPEQSAQMTDIELWMLRIVNVPLALERRGYPLHVNTTLHIHVHDDLIAANTHAFVLTVENGKGSIQTGGRGDLIMTIQGLASLYSGLHSPQHLKWMGWLDGPDDSVAIAAQIFAGSPPWIADFF
ncbi:MAG: GNAT family N-acetyltransferase [Cyanobacteria bacterium P01_A01_bin.37]